MYLNEYIQLVICRDMWCCVTPVKTLLFKGFCHEVYPACSSASPTIQQSPKHRGRIPQRGLLFQPSSQWVHVSLFVLVHVEARGGHVRKECVIRLLETQVVDDAPCAQSSARREDIMHRFITLELTCDEPCSDSVLSVVHLPARMDIHSLVHSELCDSVEF